MASERNIPSAAKVPTELAGIPQKLWNKLRKRAALLRSIGKRGLTEHQATQIAKSLNVDRATVYRWFKRFRSARTVSALAPRNVGFPKAGSRMLPAQEKIISEVITAIGRKTAAVRVVDVVKEVAQRCRAKKIAVPTRRSIDRRLIREGVRNIERRNEPVATDPPVVPGTFAVRRALDVVQIDHTKIDIIVVDDLYRAPLGRPFLSIAMDVATRCVVGMRLSFEAPSATTVALCLAQVAAPKEEWLSSLGLDFAWPMAGLPRSLHLDNGPEFHSQALERGCAQFGIEVVYRPGGRPHFGGHIERFFGTLMHRVRALPGATGSSVMGRARLAPEKNAILTLRELEQWIATEIGVHYHHGSHKGLEGGTPTRAWSQRKPVVSQEPDYRELFIAFLPAKERLVRRDGLHLNNIRYWHPTFSYLALSRTRLLVHYDPRDLSCLYARAPTGEFLEIHYADIRHPPISLWEHRAAAKQIKAESGIEEHALFAAIEKQRTIVEQAGLATRRVRSGKKPKGKPPAKKRAAEAALAQPDEVGDEDSLPSYGGEVW